MKINNGDRVKDMISGFSGIVTCRLEYLNGCTRIMVSPESLAEGKVIEAQYFDEPQLKLIKSAIHRGVTITGGYQNPPPNRATDKR